VKLIVHRIFLCNHTRKNPYAYIWVCMYSSIFSIPLVLRDTRASARTRAVWLYRHTCVPHILFWTKFALAEKHRVAKHYASKVRRPRRHVWYLAGVRPERAKRTIDWQIV